MATNRTGDLDRPSSAARPREGGGWAVMGFLVAALFVGVYLLACMTRSEAASAGTPTRAQAHQVHSSAAHSAAPAKPV